MEWVTTTAKTLPEAIDLALDNLGVDESEAEIVVLEEPSKGLFGRVRGTARVEARVKPKAIRPKTERGRNRRGRGDNKSRGERGGRGRSNDRGGRSTNNGNRGSGSGSSGSGSGSGSGGRGGRGSQRKRSGSKESTAADPTTDARSNSAADAPATADSATDSRSRSGSDPKQSTRNRPGDKGGGSSGEGGSSRRRRRSKGSGSGSDDNGNRGRQKNDKKTADNKKEETPVEEVSEHLRSFLGGLTEAFGLEGEVDIDTSETDVMVATVQGQHGLMVGPKGRTLDAIQELARVSSQRAAPSNIRIRVDVGGYRRQRAAALGDFARKAADRAVDNGIEVALEPMSPADRKAIHDALVEDDRVETRSVGTEPRRKVVVIPVSAGSARDSDEEE